MNNVESGSPVSMPVAHEPPRLVLHADCTTCGRLNRDEDAHSAVVDIALDHTNTTGHIVVLNGTTDLPGGERDTPALVAAEKSNLPTIEEILANPSASFWLRSALLAALSLDPVDAANDAELLARLLDRKCHQILGRTHEKL